MLMSILCPLNLSVRFLWCVQFLSIKHRGVKQAGGRLVPLLQAWISPFGFIFILNGEGEGESGVFGVGLRNTERAMWWYEEFWELVCAFHRAYNKHSNIQYQELICKHITERLYLSLPFHYHYLFLRLKPLFIYFPLPLFFYLFFSLVFWFYIIIYLPCILL